MLQYLMVTVSNGLSNAVPNMLAEFYFIFYMLEWESVEMYLKVLSVKQKQRPMWLFLYQMLVSVTTTLLTMTDIGWLVFGISYLRTKLLF